MNLDPETRMTVQDLAQDLRLPTSEVVRAMLLALQRQLGIPSDRAALAEILRRTLDRGPSGHSTGRITTRVGGPGLSTGHGGSVR
ncbi:MAG: hypothetical protein GX442_23635 [Candidatus Riflebacteria bacterium]|nr:hypothetical protein [Candidatus Riflebacteria bacterium]